MNSQIRYMSQDSRRLRAAVIDHLVHYIEASIHCALIARRVYPNTPTIIKKRFGINVSLYASSGIRRYVKNFLTGLRPAIMAGRIQAILVSIRSVSDAELSERFVIEFPTDFARSLILGKFSASDQTELDVACSASTILGKAYQGLEIRLGSSDNPIKGSKVWELFVHVQEVSNGAEMIDIPVGCVLMEPKAENSVRDSTNFCRLPLKSSAVDNNVVLLTYLDMKSSPTT